MDTKPRRIQRKQVKGWRKPADAVYVGRSTKWGNPFHGAFEPKRAVELYKASHSLNHLRETGQIEKLRGKDLICWCPLDQPCHADVLLRLANE